MWISSDNFIKEATSNDEVQDRMSMVEKLKGHHVQYCGTRTSKKIPMYKATVQNVLTYGREVWDVSQPKGQKLLATEMIIGGEVENQRCSMYGMTVLDNVWTKKTIYRQWYPVLKWPADHGSITP